MIGNSQAESYTFDGFGGSRHLPDSRLKFLDTETKDSARLFADKMSTYIHRSANDPSMALYRIRQHVKSKVPEIVEKDRILQKHEKKLEKVLYEVKYANIALKVNVKSNRKVKKLNEMLNYLVFRKSSSKVTNPFDPAYEHDKEIGSDDGFENEDDESLGELVADDYIGGLVEDLPISQPNDLSKNTYSPPSSPPQNKEVVGDDFDFVAKSFDDDYDDVDESEQHKEHNEGDDFQPQNFTYSDSEEDRVTGSDSRIESHEDKARKSHSNRSGGSKKVEEKKNYYISDSESGEEGEYMEETMESYLPMDEIPKEVVIAEEENFYVPTSIGDSSRSKYDDESESIIDRFVKGELGDDEQGPGVIIRSKNVNNEKNNILVSSTSVPKKRRKMRRKKRRNSDTEGAVSILQGLTSQPIQLKHSDDDGIVAKSYRYNKKSKKKRKRKRKVKSSVIIEDPIPPKNQDGGNNENVDDDDDFKPAKFDF